MHYTGWTTDGKMFDSSVARGKPATFPLDRVIAGWTEGVQLMVAGEKRRFWIPEALAYKGQREPKGMLVFDIELISFMPIRRRAAARREGAAGRRQGTASGLAYKVLKPGTGARHPKREQQVTVHYSGWTTDGKMFDSSVARGQPATFPLDGVIAGWTEGRAADGRGREDPLLDSREASPTRASGAPYGMLVFDVELIKIR